MALAKQKIVQAYIQGLVEIVSLLEQADLLAQNYKAKFIAINLDLTGTNITQAQINAVNTFVSNLHSLATGQVATVVKSKDVPSHGTQALEP